MVGGWMGWEGLAKEPKMKEPTTHGQHMHANPVATTKLKNNLTHK